MSAFGTKQTSEFTQPMSAFGGKAETMRTCCDVCLRLKADIGTATELSGSTALTIDLHQSFYASP
jgi:hypothetical protein